ncbi:ABC transporter substrate-binding protein [Microvirga sp. TS319]|uniref:ABC transporter substrate-binding protein n=1 Tax=Microvirga sp. TS319 TaxID=3241165 RepID=UPI00351A6D91
MTELNRRQFLASATAAGVASTLPSRVLAGAGNPATFGLILPLTGASASVGEDMRRGAELALERVNAKGGVLGQPLKVLIEDSAGNAQVALTAARKLVSVDRANVVMGEYSSGVTVPVREALGREGILHVNYGSSATTLRKPGGGRAFSVIGLDDVLAKFSADAIVSRNFKKAVVILPNNAFGKSMAAAFEQAYKARGGAISQMMLYTEGQPSYRRELQQLARHQPEVIVYCAYGQEAAIINREGLELGLKTTPWFGLYLSMCASDAPKPSVEDQLGAEVNFIGPDSSWYRDLYKAKYNEDFRSAFNGYVFDAVCMAAEAINKAGVLDPDPVMAAAKSLSYQGATGTITLDSDNERSRQDYLLGIVKGGAVTAL